MTLKVGDNGVVGDSRTCHLLEGCQSETIFGGCERCGAIDRVPMLCSRAQYGASFLHPLRTYRFSHKDCLCFLFDQTGFRLLKQDLRRLRE